MRGLPDDATRDALVTSPDIERLIAEGRYGQADLALRRVDALIPTLAQGNDLDPLMLALYGRAVMLRRLGAVGTDTIQACEVLERGAHEGGATLWAATACALRARVRVETGDIGGATADLARADAALATEDVTSSTGYRLLDDLAVVYARLRLHDRADEMRDRIEHTIKSRGVLERAQHWANWAGELASRSMEPVAGGAAEPDHDLLGQGVTIAAQVDDLPAEEVPATLRRGARGVRALSAAYRGRPSEALRLLGPDAFGTVQDLPLVERQIVSLAAMRAHALVGSLATARSLDDSATSASATLPHLLLEVCRTRERLWVESYAGGDLIPVLQRMNDLLVRLSWRGMDLVADTARQALEHQALRTESRTDALTGVGNRRALDEELRRLLRFSSLPLALILVDVDHFKEVNDRFTHVVGDEVLRRVAASLQLQLRTDDRLVRYGGDEFVVLLPSTGDEEANAVAERMSVAVANRPWGELADGLSVTVTTGVAAVWSLTGRRPDADAERLFRRADERLLEGKRRRPGGEGRSGSTPLARRAARPEPAAIGAGPDGGTAGQLPGAAVTRTRTAPVVITTVPEPELPRRRSRPFDPAPDDSQSLVRQEWSPPAAWAEEAVRPAEPEAAEPDWQLPPAPESADDDWQPAWQLPPAPEAEEVEEAGQGDEAEQGGVAEEPAEPDWQLPPAPEPAAPGSQEFDTPPRGMPVPAPTASYGASLDTPPRGTPVVRTPRPDPARFAGARRSAPGAAPTPPPPPEPPANGRPEPPGEDGGLLGSWPVELGGGKAPATPGHEPAPDTWPPRSRPRATPAATRSPAPQLPFTQGLTLHTPGRSRDPEPDPAPDPEPEPAPKPPPATRHAIIDLTARKRPKPFS